MKLQAEIEGTKYSVELTRDGEKTIADVDGRRYELEVSEPEPGVYLLKNGGKITEAFVSPRASSSEPVHVQIGGDSFDIKLFDPKRLRGSSGADDSGDGAAEIRTAMPGKVVKVLLEVGSQVEKGDGVIVVEAMKMQNELKAPKSGVIRNLKVVEGATVAAGDVLVVIE